MLAQRSKQSTNYLQAVCKPTHKGLNVTQVRSNIYNKYKHGPTKIANPPIDYLGIIKDFFGPEGLQWVKDEAKRIKNKAFRSTIPKIRKSNHLNIFEHFDSDQSIKNWRPVADSDTLNGFSSSSFTRSVSGHALFKGVLDTRVPDDGVTMRSGFAGVMGPPAPRDELWVKDTYYDWTKWNGLEIRFRGDGRKYNLTVNVASYASDLEAYDLMFYPIYTRGGPYWQTLRIPFSKFVFSSGAVIQDNQGKFPAYRVKFVSVILQDNVVGPFEMEIDYLGLRFDVNPFDEETCWEGYKHSHIRLRPISLGCDPPDQ